MSKNRDRLSLIAAILAAAGSGSSKTHIMFSANLSFKLLEKYLEASLALEFIKPKGSGYELTLKGRNFLKKYFSFEQRYVEAQGNLDVLGSERERLERLCLKIPENKKLAPPKMPDNAKEENVRTSGFDGSRFRKNLNLEQ